MEIKRYLLSFCLTAFAISLAMVSLGLGVESSKSGGKLQVFSDTWGGTLAPTDGNKFNVTIGQTYYIRIWGITEFETDDKLTIKIGWKDIRGADQTDFFYDVPVKEMDETKYADVPPWTAPLDAKIHSTGTVHYGIHPGRDYLARGETKPVAHIFFIPENAFGTIGSLLALLTGFGGFVLVKKRTTAL